MTHELEGLDLIPAHCRESMRHYIEDGLRPRDAFLFAVLMNDLFGTHFYVDAQNRYRIDNYIHFLTRYAPPNSFGSRAKVEAWIEDAAERRVMANAKEPQP